MRSLLALRYSAPAIAKELARLHGKARAPHVNTIRNHARQLRRDSSQPWTLADGDFAAAQARAVMEELRALDELSGGRVLTVTKREAWWIARLRAVWPDMPSDGSAYLWAREYLAAEGDDERTSALDFRLRYLGPGRLPVGRTRRRDRGPVVEPRGGGR
jgi:hypothetical protein